MRLEDKYMSGIGPSELSRTQGTEAIDRKAGKGAGGVGPSGGADEVTLSGLTERLQGLSAQLEAEGEGSAARSAKLNELSALVESGKYAPDVERVSGALIEGMQAEKQ
ncbi:MAG TPA: flagellar biosynthesis anti-sigma factor FlgM [Paludibaculum sp.]|jgi:anti-sigma28 factor (negative regulator of flagellin synthesis)